MASAGQPVELEAEQELSALDCELLKDRKIRYRPVAVEKLVNMSLLAPLHQNVSQREQYEPQQAKWNHHLVQEISIAMITSFKALQSKVTGVNRFAHEVDTSEGSQDLEGHFDMEEKESHVDDLEQDPFDVVEPSHQE